MQIFPGKVIERSCLLWVYHADDISRHLESFELEFVSSLQRFDNVTELSISVERDIWIKVDFPHVRQFDRASLAEIFSQVDIQFGVEYAIGLMDFVRMDFVNNGERYFAYWDRRVWIALVSWQIGGLDAHNSESALIEYVTLSDRTEFLRILKENYEMENLKSCGTMRVRAVSVS